MVPRAVLYVLILAVGLFGALNAAAPDGRSGRGPTLFAAPLGDNGDNSANGNDNGDNSANLNDNGDNGDNSGNGNVARSATATPTPTVGPTATPTRVPQAAPAPPPASAPPPPAVAQGPCSFKLGFAALASLIPGIVGQCRTDEMHNALNGDGLQLTTGGLLVWRKSDNWTAFTNGYQTWLNGPCGLQTRLNTERFPWEGAPGSGCV